MRVDMAYVNCLGERVDLGGPDRYLHYFEHEVRNWEWDYSVPTSGAAPVFSRRPSKPRELSFPVGIAAPTPEEGIELRNRVESIGERDVVAGKAGRLYVGDWYLRCWIIGCEPTDYWMDDRICELDLKLLVQTPGWVLDHDYALTPGAGAGGGAGKDFPADFPLEFMRGRQQTIVYNQSLEGMDFRLLVMGPATDPAVEIGSNLYKVNVEVPAGYTLEVDSAAKTVTLSSPTGETEDAYRYREPGASGSGTYIFEKLPVGASEIDWSGGYSLHLTAYEVQSSCPWEVG